MGAVVCGVCCVLPFAFPAVAAAGTGGLLAWFAGAHSWATALAAVIVAGAWISIGFQSHRAWQKPSRATLYMMTLATAVLIVAVPLATNRTSPDSSGGATVTAGQVETLGSLAHRGDG
jgi:hypothetical protein